MNVRAIAHSDVLRWYQMRRIYWPDSTENKLQQEMTAIFENAKYNQVYVCEIETHDIVAFIEISFRQRMRGCAVSPVAYIEGLYVEPNYRMQGIAKALVTEAENWAKRCGCKEIALDVSLENATNRLFQDKLGFVEADRIITYKKKLADKK